MRLLAPHSNFVGAFYVGLSAKLFGGEITPNGNNDADNGNPDIINNARNQLYESKAAIGSDVHKIHADQVARYQMLTDSDTILNHPEVYYLLWNYGPRGIAHLTQRELAAHLSQGVRSLLVLPLPLLQAGVFGASPWKITGSKRWSSYHMLTPTTRKRFFSDWSAQCSDLGVSSDDYESIDYTLSAKKYKCRNIGSITMREIRPKSWRGLELQC